VCGDAGGLDGGTLDGGDPTEDAPGSDSPVDDPCVAADGLPVARYCVGTGVVRECESDSDLACRGDQHCEPYIVDSTHHAGCYLDGSAPCDLAIDPPASCSGAVITYCQEGAGPVPTAVDLDCRRTLGWDDATCVASGDSFRCTAPLSTPCDPATDLPRCDGPLQISCRTVSRDGPVWVRDSCGAGLACFESRVDGRGVCLGSDATPTTPITPGSNAERCDDETTIRLSTDGYTYSIHCPVTTQFTPGGEVTEQQVCLVDGLGGGECASPADVVPCSAGTPPVCSTPGSEPNPSSRACVDQGDGRRLRASRPCLIPYGTSFVSSTCEGGVCDHIGPCADTDPPACVSGFRVVCEPTTLVWTAERCATSCSDGACV